jgi:hypothetical protein
VKLGEYELNQIYTGDARELSKGIPDESVDLIFTDPIYENVDDYKWLGETAARILKPNSACLVWHAQKRLFETLQAVQNETIEFIWQIACYRPALNIFGAMKMFSCWHSILVFRKGIPTVNKPTRDYFVDGNPALLSGNHKWHKQAGPYLYYIDRLTSTQAIIFDPFTGGGTVPASCKVLNRNFLAFEQDWFKTLSDQQKQEIIELLYGAGSFTQGVYLGPHPIKENFGINVGSKPTASTKGICPTCKRPY